MRSPTTIPMQLSTNEFTIPITTPSGKSVRIPGINNKQYQEILKFCANRDYEGLEALFENIIFSKIPVHLDCLDKFYILIVVRIFFVDENIMLEAGDKEVTVSLHRVLRNLDELDISSKFYKVDDITIELGMPSRLYYADLDDYLSNIIISISIEGKSNINFSEITEDEKVKILEFLPNKTLSVIYNHFNNLVDTFKDFTIVEENKVFDVERLSFNLISSNLIGFIGSIYGFNLVSFFEMLYVFVNKMNCDSNLFYSLSPIDSKVLLNMFREEVKKQNDSLNQSEHG